MPEVLARLGARARVGDEERAAEAGQLVDDGAACLCIVPDDILYSVRVCMHVLYASSRDRAVVCRFYRIYILASWYSRRRTGR